MSNLKLGDFVTIRLKDGLHLGRVVKVTESLPFNWIRVQLDKSEVIEEAEPYFDKIVNSESFSIIQHVDQLNSNFVNCCPAREKAARLLCDIEDLSKEEYFALEDYITGILNNSEIKTNLPKIDHYLCQLRKDIRRIWRNKMTDKERDFADEIELDDLIDEIAESLKLDFEDDKYPFDKEIKERIMLFFAYSKYVNKWEEEHEEGEPASLDEFFMNEYVDEDAAKYYNLVHLQPEE